MSFGSISRRHGFALLAALLFLYGNNVSAMHPTICARAVAHSLPILQQANPLYQRVSGEWINPTPLVLSHLGLGNFIDDNHLRFYAIGFEGSAIYSSVPENRFQKLISIDPASLRGQPVLTLGEGYGGLMPWFIKMGALPRAVDEHAYDEATEYVGRYWHEVVKGDAGELNMIDDESQALVVSHDLLEGLPGEPSLRISTNDHRRRVIAESFRVVRAGGNIRLSLRLAAPGKTAYRFANDPQLKRFVTDWARQLVADSLPQGAKYDLALLLGKHQLELQDLSEESGKTEAELLEEMFDSGYIPKGTTVKNFRENLKVVTGFPNLVLTIAIKKPERFSFLDYLRIF